MTSLLTDDQILDLDGGVGIRDDGFLFELIDAARNSLGVLDVDFGRPPTVTLDTNRSVIRTCTSLSVSGADLSAIDVKRDRVRPWMTLQNGSRKPLGVFMFGNDNRAPRSWGSTMTPDLFDETFLVAQPLSRPAGLAPGGSILTLLMALVDSVGLADVDFSGLDDAPASSALPYKTGSGRKVAIDALAALLGSYPPFIDNNGTYRPKPAPVAGQPVDHVYESGGRIHADTVVITNSAYAAPNRYIVVSDGSASSIVGTYDLPPEAPNSAANRNGEIIVSQSTMQGLPSVALADIAARIKALTDRNSYTKASWSSVADPRHDAFDLDQLYGARYQETAESITCGPGAAMTHDAIGLFE